MVFTALPCRTRFVSRSHDVFFMCFWALALVRVGAGLVWFFLSFLSCLVLFLLLLLSLCRVC